MHKLCKAAIERAPTGEESRRYGRGDTGTPVLSGVRPWVGRVLDGCNQVRWWDAKFCRSTASNASAERVSSVSPIEVSEATAMGSGGCNDGNGHGGER